MPLAGPDHSHAKIVVENRAAEPDFLEFLRDIYGSPPIRAGSDLSLPLSSSASFYHSLQSTAMWMCLSSPPSRARDARPPARAPPAAVPRRRPSSAPSRPQLKICATSV